MKLKYDNINVWSEVKLEIVKKYASAYSKIMNKQQKIRRHIYIDACAGSGKHISKETGELVSGSPSNALNINPPFKEFHFIDLDGDKANELRQLTHDSSEVFVYEADCNKVLLGDVFPRCLYGDFHRGLCLLDPYGLSIDWNVTQKAGEMLSIEIFYNFMIMDANMNILWHDPDKVSDAQIARMDAVWGNRSWRDVAYKKTDPDLFGETTEEKVGNKEISEAFRERLKSVAGFKFVPEPMPMRNEKGSVVYYLFFASPNETGAKIVGDIFNKYKNRGMV